MGGEIMKRYNMQEFLENRIMELKGRLNSCNKIERRIEDVTE